MCKFRSVLIIMLVGVFSIGVLGASVADESDPFTKTVSGKAIVINHGNQFVILGENFVQTRVVIAGTIPPRANQPYGSLSRQRLAETIIGKNVSLRYKLGPNGEFVAKVTLDGKDLGETLVEDGYLWAIRGYDALPYLVAAQERARSGGHGMWGVESKPPVYPDDWDAYQESRPKDPWYGQMWRMTKRFFSDLF